LGNICTVEASSGNGAGLHFPLTRAIELGIGNAAFNTKRSMSQITFFVQQFSQVKNGHGFFRGRSYISEGCLCQQVNGFVDIAILLVNTAECRGRKRELVIGEVMLGPGSGAR
jgi:hypothetical protein